MIGSRPASLESIQTLEALQLHLASILESVPDAMIIINQAGTILQFSKAARELFGYSEAESIGKHVSILMTSRDADLHDAYMSRYEETQKPRIIGIGRVVMARKANGTEFPIDLKIGEAKIGDTSIYTGFLRDLTEKQQSELRMREMQAELVHFSRMSAVGTMASALAHELNQPLTAIANYLEAGRDILDAPDAEGLAMVQEAMDEAAKQSVRAGKIVRKLRDYVARGEISARATPLRPLLNDAVSLARIGTASDTVKITCVVDPSIKYVSVDPIQIQQVVINLLRNAFEALADLAGAEIEIEAERTPEGHAAISICDNGPGIEPEIASQLFRPFTTSKTSGMGLGLSICQTIIDAHGGRIYAETTGAGGTCFRFTLPITEEDPEDV
jgi:two-component system, LuxR family, sensor kinase FixL